MKRVMAGAVALAMTSPALAQGKSQQSHGHGAPPSHSALPPPAEIVNPGGAAPFAWVDDSSLLTPGGVFVAASMTRWTGTDVSELYAPVVDFAMGLTPRVQLGASVPRIVGSSDPGGAAGGLGTTFVNAKVGIFDSPPRGLKVAVAPAIEIVNPAAQVSTPNQSRVRFGVPASVELDRGQHRVYASAGHFSGGVWFAGGGGGLQATPRLGLSVSFSRAWTTTDATVGPAQLRSELAGGASYSFASNAGLFGSIGHTIATDDANGAGLTMGVGVFVTARPATRVAK